MEAVTHPGHAGSCSLAPGRISYVLEAHLPSPGTGWAKADAGHLRRLLLDYVGYHHEDRMHLGLGKGTPAGRIYSANAEGVISQDRLGRLHHRYDRAA